MNQTAGWIMAALALVSPGGCDQLKERAGIQDPAKLEAEGKAIGSACRHAGWGIEDCFRLNPDASKPAMFSGWKEMNEYMLKNNMQPLPPTVPLESEAPPPQKKKKIIELEPIDKSAHGEDAAGKTGDKKGAHSKGAAGHDDEASAGKDKTHEEPAH